MHALFNAGYCSLNTKIFQPISIGMRSLETQGIIYGRQEQWRQPIVPWRGFLRIP